MKPLTNDPALGLVEEKVVAGAWLSQADGEALFASGDLFGIGRLADFANRRLNGDVVYYNRNRHINYTNVCALSCKFCSFYRKKGEDGAYEMSVDEVVAAAVKAHESGATEVHVVGGLHPWLKFDYYLDLMRGIKQAASTLHVKAFTAIEIVHFSRIAKTTVEDVLTQLRDAGLGSLPGGGAEIFDDRVHDAVFKGKVREDRWFDVHRTAHRLGIYTNATMLYGHVETPAERVGHLIKLRALQAESLGARREGGGVTREGMRGKQDAELPSSLTPHASTLTPAFFNCIIPLSFIPEDSELGDLPGPTGLTDLKTLAISRLMTPNIANTKAFWIMQGVHLSQLSLDWGVNDLDGTVVWYDITKRKDAASHSFGTHQEMHVEDIQRLIRQAGKTPVERDTLYHPIRREVPELVTV